jgi:hypothetical protein
MKFEHGISHKVFEILYDDFNTGIWKSEKEMWRAPYNIWNPSMNSHIVLNIDKEGF